MRFEWDDRKNELNRAKHGLSFEEATVIWDGFVFTREDGRRDYGETRWLSLGLLSGDVVILVAHTKRRGHVRLISARPASRTERTIYYGSLKEAVARN